MAAAATQIAVERAANLGFGRPRIAVEQVGRRNDHAAGAVAALHGLLVDEGLLQWMSWSRVPSPSSVVISLGLRCAIGITQERTAAPLMRPRRRRIAQRQTEFRAIELEIVTQHVKQLRIRLGLDRTGRSH